MISLNLKWQAQCIHCGQPLPVNSVSQQILCQHCGNITGIPLEIWQILVRPHLIESTELKPEEQSWANGSMAGTGDYSLEFGRMSPHCPSCNTPWDIDSLIRLAGDEESLYHCPACQSVYAIRPVPDWFTQVMPFSRYLVGEEAPQDSGAQLNSTEGISIFCVHCGGSLSLDGSSRKVTCQYCNNDLLIPDDIWSRLHPVTLSHFWYILVDMRDRAGLLPPRIDEFLDLAALPDGNTIVLWQQDCTGHIACVSREGGLLWHQKDFDMDDHSRLLYDQGHHQVWAMDLWEARAYAFDCNTGHINHKIINEKDEDNMISIKDHEGIAVFTDGSIIVNRFWNLEKIQNMNRFPGIMKNFNPARIMMYTNRTLRRFDHNGKRITLWEGVEDENLEFQEEISFKELKDRPLIIPEESWIMGGPENTFYILDRDKGQMRVYDHKGTLIETRQPKLKKVKHIQDCDIAEDGTIFIIYDHKKSIDGMEFSHVGRIDKDDSFTVLIGPHHNDQSIGTDCENIAVSPLGDIHLCDYDFDNFRILDREGCLLWRSPGTIAKGDKDLTEELEESR